MTTPDFLRSIPSTRSAECHRVNCNRQVISVDASDGAACRLLSTRRWIAHPGQDGTLECGLENESLLNVQATSTSRHLPRLNGGLQQLLPFLTADDGRRYQISMRSVAQLSEPQPLLDHESSGSSPHISQFVHDFARGLIRVAQGVQIGRLIAEIAIAFPTASVAVIVPSWRAGLETVRALGNVRVRYRRITPAQPPNWDERIVVGTALSMGHSEVELEKRDLLIAYDAVSVLGEQGQLAFSGPDIRGRMFGFVRDDARISGWQKDWLYAAFGFQQLEVPAHGMDVADVRLRLLRADVPAVSAKNRLDLKRRGLWLNRARNRLVANVAEHYSAQPDSRVLVLTDNIEQLDALCALLPGWPTLARVGLGSDVLGEFGHLGSRYSPWRQIERRLLSTVLASDCRDLGIYTSIIWAGGGNAPPNLRPSMFWKRPGSNMTVEFVDFLDRSHYHLRRDSQSRASHYRQRGWPTANDSVTPANRRMNAFLAARPKERVG